MTRIVVVGAGIGGCCAALAAKEAEPDAEVAVLSLAPERYRYESGTLNLLGYTEPEEGPVERPLVAMRRLPEDHPYNLVGDRTVREALDFFDERFEAGDDLPYRSGKNRNALVPTVTGGVRPASRYPEGVAAGLVSSQREMHLVGFDQVTHLDAELVADRLDGALPYEVNATTIQVPLEVSEYPSLESLARAFDENRKTDDGRPLREAVAQAVRPALDIEPRVGFPAVLGLDEHEAVGRDMESLLQAEVFEIPGGEPSIPGLRLRTRLFELLESAGIELVEASVEGFESRDGTIQSVSIDDGSETGETPVGGDSFVLATGDVAAGGLVGTGDAFVEPVFDCPTTGAARPIDRSESRALGDHPFARSGVEVTPELQPASAGDPPLYENLFAAGTILGGHNFVTEHSRSGVALVTGYEAGRLAVEQK